MSSVDRRLFPFFPQADRMRENNKRISEVHKLFESQPALEGRYFYRGYFIEQELIEADGTGVQAIIDIYLEGIRLEKCPACAARLLFSHIEPSRLNNELPDYDCQKGVGYLLEVIRARGIFEYIDHEKKIMRLLNFLYNYLDMSIILRQHLIKR